MLPLTAPIWTVNIGEYRLTRIHQFKVVASRHVHIGLAEIRLPAAGVPSFERGQPLAIAQGYRESGLWSVFEGTVRRVHRQGDELVIFGADPMAPVIGTRVSRSFVGATPQEIVRWAVAQSGETRMQLSSRRYAPMARFVADGTVGEVLDAVRTAWGLEADSYWIPELGVWWGSADESPRRRTVPAAIGYGRNLLRYEADDDGSSGTLTAVAMPVYHSQVLKLEDSRRWTGVRQVLVDRVTYKARPAEVTIEWTRLGAS